MIRGLANRTGFLALAFLVSLTGTLSTPHEAKAATAAPAKYNPGHYMRAGIGENMTNFANRNNLRGSQFNGAAGRYLWRMLEPRPGVYDFSVITKDLEILRSMNKRLMVMIQTSDWRDKKSRGAPDYLASPTYNGGFFYRADGRVMTKRYNPMVNDRFMRLLAELGKHFDKDPYVEAIVLEETALGIAGGSNVGDYSASLWVSELKKTMSAGKRSLPTTNLIQQINFISGDGSLLAEVANHAATAGVHLGCPNSRPGFDALEDKAYRLLRSAPYTVKTSLAVEAPDYTFFWDKSVATAQRIPKLFNFLINDVGANYVLWQTWTQPNDLFIEQVHPYITRQAGLINY